MSDNALSLHLGLCGALSGAGPRYLPCADRNDPAITDEPEVLVTDAASDETPVQPGSRTALFDPNMQERKDEIDALRARVDVILNKMVQNSGDDVTRLRQKIAEMRTGPPQPQQVPTPPPAPTAASMATNKPWTTPATIATKPWNTSDPKNCPLSPMTANTTATNATSTTNNSATPSADTEPHANLSMKKQAAAKKTEGYILTPTIDDDGRDDDDDIDDMEFDFKVAPLSPSKSVQMAELGSIAQPRGKKESKDPPASLKASESMLLPDPGGDDSYCSGSSSGSRCNSPPPGSVLFEAAARKAESVVGHEREHQEHLEREQLQQQLVKTKQLLQEQQEKLEQKQKQNQKRRQTPPSPENLDAQSRASKTTLRTAKTCPAIVQPRSPRTKQQQQRPAPVAQTRPSPPKVETVPQPELVEIIDADEQQKREPVSVAPPVPEVINTTMVADTAVLDTAVINTTGADTAVVTTADPPATPVGQRPTAAAPQRLERSKSPPPPVANVNIPHIVKPTVPGSTASVGSHSDSSLTRPPSPSPVGEITLVEEVSEQRIRDPYGDKGLYTGVLVKRRPHGRGTMKYDDGRHYEGHWNHGRWHGVGRAIFANNDIFEGSYDMDQRHGHGMYQWNDGRVYTGQFFQDQRQGRGTYTWPDGAVYQGEFKAGHRHGQGMYRFADGSVYTGEWESGKYHGVGECRWSDGRSYRGEWKEGRANGYGVETRPNGTIRHDGEWKDDRPIRDSKRTTQNEAVAK